MIIYIDLVLIENIIMNSILLIVTAIVLKDEIHYIRILIASLIGAIYSIVAYATRLNIYSNVFLKIILSIVIIYIAFNPQSIKKMWKSLLLFYLVSFVFGGVTFFLIYLIKPQEILMKNGLFLGTYTIKNIVLGAIVSFFIIISTFKIIKTKMTKEDMLCSIKIKINKKEIFTKSLIDTGNLLKEPISGMPVIVVEHTLLYDCLPKEILNNLENIIRG